MAAPAPGKRSNFYQQTLPSWRPILTPCAVISTFLVISVLFIPLGFVFKSASDSVVEYSIQYDGSGTKENAHKCQIGEGQEMSCSVTFDVKEEMKAPVYVYYELDEFFQNHRQYMKSRSDKQLRGEIFTAKDDLVDCEPKITADDGRILHPCGLIASSYFNDIFSLNTVKNPGFTMLETGISWKSDREDKFKAVTAADKLKYNSTHKFITEMYPELESVENEHFIVWMRTAALPSFRKLYGRIEKTIPAGTKLIFDIQAKFLVSTFGGKKSLVLSTTSFLGGKNAFLGTAYIVVGFLCLIAAVLFLAKHKISGRELGDTRYLVWRNRS